MNLAVLNGLGVIRWLSSICLCENTSFCAFRILYRSSRRPWFAWPEFVLYHDGVLLSAHPHRLKFRTPHQCYFLGGRVVGSMALMPEVNIVYIAVAEMFAMSLGLSVPGSMM